jgi:ABC-type polysaccharide/polyol phosphate export permease
MSQVNCSGTQSLLSPLDCFCTDYTEIWGHVLFWALLLSALIYITTGVILAMRLPGVTKKIRLLIPFLYFVYGILRLICVEAVASKLVILYMEQKCTLTTFWWGRGAIDKWEGRVRSVSGVKRTLDKGCQPLQRGDVDGRCVGGVPGRGILSSP